MGGAVDITAETLPQWIAYDMAKDPAWVHLDAGRAIADCHGLCYWTQPWAAHAQTLIKQWTPEARLDPVWIKAWIEWYIGWVQSVQDIVKAETGMALGEDRNTPGYRVTKC